MNSQQVKKKSDWFHKKDFGNHNDVNTGSVNSEHISCHDNFNDEIKISDAKKKSSYSIW